MKLSILIAALHSRTDLLTELKAHLYGQIALNKAHDHVEVIVSIDGGKMSIGAKRNKLLDESTGEYIAFIDDDDQIADSYVQKILNAIESAPDVIGLNLIHYLNGDLYGFTEHSIAHKDWQNIMQPNGQWRFTRCPNHLNPVKRQHAITTRFPEIRYGEDKDYSLRLYPKLKTESMISDPIYFYMQKQ